MVFTLLSQRIREFLEEIKCMSPILGVREKGIRAFGNYLDLSGEVK